MTHGVEMHASAAHWNHVYDTKDVTQVSWYQAIPAPSLRLISAHSPPSASVVDVGAGASVLVDHLLDRGHRDLTLVDISSSALAITLARLGSRVPLPTTLATDLLAWVPGRTFDVWHDRAVFHFLDEPDAIARYRNILCASVPSGGLAVVAAFHLTGPARCSDLPTARYDAESLHGALGGPATWHRLEAFVDAHPHPRGGTQAFQYLALRKA